MKKVTLIGDCHSARILEHWDPKTCPIDFKSWGKGGSTAWLSNPEDLALSKAVSSGTEKEPLYTEYNNSLFISFDKIKDQDLILPWLGYVDIRQYLPNHKNTEICVENYVNRFVKYFNKSEIRFIEPLPQFIPLLIKWPGLHPEFSFEERIKENNEFIKLLRIHSKKLGLQEPISQDQIFDALGFSQNEMTEDKSIKNSVHPVDGFTQEHMGKIYNLIISEALK